MRIARAMIKIEENGRSDEFSLSRIIESEKDFLEFISNFVESDQRDSGINGVLRKWGYDIEVVAKKSDEEM